LPPRFILVAKKKQDSYFATSFTQSAVFWLPGLPKIIISTISSASRDIYIPLPHSKIELFSPSD
jgi:hypothetical protein